MNYRFLMRHHIFCHLPPFPVFHNSATTVAPGPAGVDDSFSWKFMLFLNEISVGGTTHKRERGGNPCNDCDKAFKSLPMPNYHKIWQHSGHVLACKGCGKKFNPNNSINWQKKHVCGKPDHMKSFCHFSMWGKDQHWGDNSQYEHKGGRKRGNGRFSHSPERGQTSFTLSIWNIVCWFWISLFV